MLRGDLFLPAGLQRLRESLPVGIQQFCCVYMFASKTLVNAPLGSSGDSKEWIRLETAPGEAVITFNDRLCI